MHPFLAAAEAGNIIYILSSPAKYVITIKGNIRFKVTDGSTFMIKPGVVLLAEDLKGTGHSWDMVKSKEWERLYIPISENADDFFVRDGQ